MAAARLSNAACRIENLGLFIGPPTVINAHGPFFLHRSERHLEITADSNGSGDCFVLAVVLGLHLVKRVIMRFAEVRDDILSGSVSERLVRMQRHDAVVA